MLFHSLDQDEDTYIPPNRNYQPISAIHLSNSEHSLAFPCRRSPLRTLFMTHFRYFLMCCIFCYNFTIFSRTFT